MILDILATEARKRVEADKREVSADAMRAVALHACTQSDGRPRHRFADALADDGLAFICEVKKASPSKGVISDDFPYLDIARAYVEGGADAVSCLTEPTRFLGSDRIFTDIRAEIDVPMIRKDFTVDDYQLYQARVMGADAVLLICALLDTATISRYLGICDELGMDALVEAHDADEIASAVSAGARIVGVNNRNLRDFSVDTSTASRLRETVPADCLFVSESGIAGIDDAIAAKDAGADAVLVGEYLMRSDDPAACIAELKAACR